MEAATIIKDLRQRFASAPMVMKIVIINAAVFVLLRVCVIFAIFSGSDSAQTAVLHCVEMPASPSLLICRPWTVITYMWAQYDVMHILFNMLWLYWFGALFETVRSGRTMLALYFYGGLAGAVLFMAACATMPLFSHTSNWLIGASASVIAIVTATAILMPDYKFNLLFLGPVSLKWIAIVTVGLDLIGITSGNAGGHIAHIGGAIAGAAYALLLRRGTDITRPAIRLMDRISRMFAPKARRPEPRRESASDVERDRSRLDAILEKIKRSGYSSLTTEERHLLFDISNREKRR